jgi:uncharacterized protein YqcC (DUF446 family)
MRCFFIGPSCAKVAAKIAQIECEMKRIGMWQEQPLAPEQRDVRTAFGQGVMSFEQWLQFVFIPNVKAIMASKARFPAHSEVSAQAFKEWVAWGSLENTEHLQDLLREFDGLFDGPIVYLFRQIDVLADKLAGRR